MQSEGKLAPGVAKKYPSAIAAYGIIARCVSGPGQGQMGALQKS